MSHIFHRLTLKVIHLKLNVAACVGFLVINVIYNDNPSHPLSTWFPRT